MITGLLQLIAGLWPYILSLTVGFSSAWWIQDLRVESAKNDLAQYEVAVGQRIIEEQVRTQKLNEDTNNDWQKNLDALHSYYKYGGGRVLPSCSTVPTGGVPGAPGSTHAGPTNVAAGPEGDAAWPDVTVEECAVTTLQLLSLQAWTRGVAK